MQAFRMSAQKAVLILFVARGIALIHREIPPSITLKSNPDWLRQFQKDVLATMKRPIFSCPEISLKSPLKITKETMENIKELIEPARRKFTSACNEYVEKHPKISFSRARTLIDIFKVAWPEIADLYDQINLKVINESSQVSQLKEYEKLYISDWAYYRLSLTQYMLTALLMGDSKEFVIEERMDVDQTNTIEARSHILVPAMSLESKSVSESTSIGRPRIRPHLSGIELSVPGQLTTRFVKLTKEGLFDLTSLDKPTASFKKKSETEKSIPVEDLTQESVRKRIRQASIERRKEETCQQGKFGEVLQTYRLQEAARAATISKQRLDTGTPRTFFGTSPVRPPITRQSLSGRKTTTSAMSGPSDPDIVIETPTSSDEVFKRPATPKVKEASLTITTTPETKVVQAQQKEDPYKYFVEIEAPAYMFMMENQYYAQNTITGQYTVLNCETPRPIITELVSTVAAATVTDTAKTFSQANRSFGSLPKDRWEPQESLIEKLNNEAKNLQYLYGIEDRRYLLKKKQLDWTIAMDKRHRDIKEAEAAK